MTDKEKLHQILSSLWKNDNSVGKTYYNQALQDVQTAIDLQEESVSDIEAYQSRWGKSIGFIDESTSEEIGDYDHKAVMESLHPQLKEEPTIPDIVDEHYDEMLGEEPKECMYSKDHYTDEDRKVLCDGYEEECEYSKKEEPVSEELKKAAIEICSKVLKGETITIDGYEYVVLSDAEECFKAGAKWQKEKEYTCYEEAFEDGAAWKVENLWKPADGDDLPKIDREVIALLDNGKVVFAHRPPEYWDGKNIVTGKVTRHYPKTYDKGGWNIPNVKFWLDLELPIKKD